MLAVSISHIFNAGYQVIKSFVNRITQLFLNIFRRTPEKAPDKLDKQVVDLTRDAQPNIFQRQGHLIRQKSVIERHVRQNGLTNQFNTHHIVDKIDDSYVKTCKEDQFKAQSALIEKLAWDIAQILGHEDYFAPTGIVRFKSKTVEMLDGEIQVRRFVNQETEYASYQTDSGALLQNNSNLLSLEGFDDVFSLILIYGMYDSHNNNILAKDGKPIFFDNSRILTPTHVFLSNCYGHMLPLRLELIGHERALKPMTAESRAYILKRVNSTLLRQESLKKFLNDPFVQAQYELLGLAWFDADKSVKAMEERLTIMKQALESDNNVTYNDLVYAIYPKIKLYTALLLPYVLNAYPNMTRESALGWVGYTSFVELFERSEKVDTVKIPLIEANDTLATLYQKVINGPHINYARDSLKDDFGELSRSVPKTHPKYLLFAALVFQYKLGKNANYTFEDLTEHLTETDITHCFLQTKSVQKVEIADFDPADTFEEIFRKTKEGPFRKITQKEAEEELLKEAEVNAIEDRDSSSRINNHMCQLLGHRLVSYPASYIVKGGIYHINQFLIPGQFVIAHKGAKLPPLSLSQFKQWLMDGILPLPQAQAKAEIDALGCNEITFIYQNSPSEFLTLIKNGETKYFQRMFGKKFIIYRAYRDNAGKLTVQPISKLTAIPKSEPLPMSKKLTHPDAQNIILSTVPGYYIAVIDDVYLPPMFEDDLIKWFDSDRAEYHRLVKYKDKGSVVVTQEELEDDLDVFINGDPTLYQIVDTNPVKHVYYECVDGEIFTYEVVERGENVGYMKNGTWVKLF